jgi:hypothetical protein
MEERIACPRCGNACVPPRGGGAYRCPACRGLLTAGPQGGGRTGTPKVPGDRQVERRAALRKRAAVWAGLTVVGVLVVLAPRLAGRPPAAALDPAFGPPFGVAGEGSGPAGGGPPVPSPAEAEARLRERVRGLEEDAAREPGAVDLWVNLVGLHVDLARRAGGTAAKVGARELARARQALVRGEAAARGTEEGGMFAWWRNEVEAVAQGELHPPAESTMGPLSGSRAPRPDATVGAPLVGALGRPQGGGKTGYPPTTPTKGGGAALWRERQRATAAGAGPRGTSGWPTQGAAHSPLPSPESRTRARDWQELLAKQRTRRAEQKAQNLLRIRQWETDRRREQQALEARLERAIAHRPDQAWPYLQLGRALLSRVQDPSLGVGWFPYEAMAMGPGPTTNATPDYSAYRREIERAILLYRRAAAVARAREHRVWAYVRLSDAYGMLRRPDQAKEVLEKASQIQPHNPLVWARLAAVYSRLGEHANMMEATKRRSESDRIAWTYAEFLF